MGREYWNCPDLPSGSASSQYFLLQESEDEEDDDEEEDDEEDEEEDEDGDIEMADEPAPQLFSPSKRKKKQADEASAAGTESTEATLVASEADDAETEADTGAASVDDGLPHPRVCIRCRSILKTLSHQQLLTTDPTITAVRVPPRLLRADDERVAGGAD